MKKSITILALLVLAAGLLLFWRWPAPATALAPAQAAVGAAPAGQLAEPSLPGAPLPASLADTQVDGELRVDAAGNLVINNGLRRVFDYFLSAYGEEGLPSLVSRIRSYLRQQLPAGAAAQAERVLDAYLAYREALTQLKPQGQESGLGAIREQMRQVAELRTRFLSREVIVAFFDEEDAYDRYTLARMELMENPGLSPGQKAQALSALLASQPPELQESVRLLSQYQELNTLTEAWQQRGGSAQELRALREQLVGVEATQRLEQLDRERSAWDGRMRSYLGARASLLNNAGLSPEAREQEITALRNSRFSAEEGLRVQNLERLYDQGQY